jgi:hypothetical protein
MNTNLLKKCRCIQNFGGAKNPIYKGRLEREPKAGHVVIEIKAFGAKVAALAGASGAPSMAAVPNIRAPASTLNRICPQRPADWR